MSATQQQNVAQLQSDLMDMKGQSQVTQAQKDALADSMMTLAEGTVKPSEESVNKLASDLSDAVADSTISKTESYKLMQDVTAVMNSANVPKSEVEAVIADAQAILSASNVDSADAALIKSDLQAIYTELSKNATNAQTQIQQNTTGTPPATRIQQRRQQR